MTPTQPLKPITGEVRNLEESSHDIVVLKFADSKIPVFTETRNKEYIKYGEKNAYPEYLTFLFNKSAIHNTLISGKANYIFGEGFENGNFQVNRTGETLNDIAKKTALDVELYGGFRLQIIFNFQGKIAEIYHIDYSTLRKGKEDGYYYKECWNQYKNGEWIENRTEEEVYYPSFNPLYPSGVHIYAYDEYRPMQRFYPLPDYIGCLNYVETDIEIGKFHLSSMRNGLMPSKMIQFYDGDVPDEKKREIEKRFERKFTGSESAGKFILVFNKTKDKTVDVSDLSQTELDKLFVELNKTCQQQILSGHQITSPMLFGIKTEGQLGGTTELNVAYTIFQNTYAKPKAQALDREFAYLLKYSVFPQGIYELKPTDPVGLQVDVKDVINSLPKEYVFDILGIPKELWDKPNIGEDNRPTPTIPIAPPAQAASVPGSSRNMEMTNSVLQNLSGRQHQQVMRVLHQYDKGKMNADRAKTFLRAGYGFSEDEINVLLGIPTKMSFSEDLDNVLSLFSACGDSKNDFEIINSKKVCFSNDYEMESDEEVWREQAFKTYDITLTENRIIELIKKDKRITPEVIATTIGETTDFVENKIDSLIKRGYIETSVEQIGVDEIINRIIPESDITAPPPRAGAINPTQVFVKYSYEGPRDDRNRPFCAKMLELNRLYSRADIEKISQRLGYSVFDRRGGFWRHKGTDVTTPYCRHIWKSNIVVKK